MASAQKSQLREILLRLKTFVQPETNSLDERLMNAAFRAVSGPGCFIDIKIGMAAEEKFGALLHWKQQRRLIGEKTTSSKRQDAKEDDEDDVYNTFPGSQSDHGHVRDNSSVVHRRLDPRNRRPQGSISPAYGLLIKFKTSPEARVSPPPPCSRAI